MSKDQLRYLHRATACGFDGDSREAGQATGELTGLCAARREWATGEYGGALRRPVSVKDPRHA